MALTASFEDLQKTTPLEVAFVDPSFWVQIAYGSALRHLAHAFPSLIVLITSTLSYPSEGRKRTCGLGLL